MIRPKRFWYAVATLVGSTVGIGIYGIPFTFAKAGFGIGFLFMAVISGLVLIKNLIYGEVVLRTHQRHQFFGYTQIYLGPIAKRINLFTFWLAVYGGLIGVIIISGNFLTNIFNSVSPATFSTIFIIVMAVLVSMGLRTVSRFDLFVMFLFGAIVMTIGTWGARHVSLANYIFTTRNLWFLPFGVIMLAMDSTPGIPLVREVLAGEERHYKKAIIWGTLIPAVLYFIFTLVIVGVSGEGTSPDAISGLFGPLGQKIVVVGSLFGFLTSSTIFLNLATALRESFLEDLHFKKPWTWLLVLAPAYLLYLSGIRNFIDIIGLVGGVAISIEAILLIMTYIKAKKHGDRIPEYSILVPKWLLYLMMLIFAAGAVYTLVVK